MRNLLMCDTMDRFASVLAMLTAALGAASDLLARAFAKVDAGGDAAAGDAELIEFALTLPNFVTSRLQGLLTEVEKDVALVKTEEKKAEEAKMTSANAVFSATAAFMLLNRVSQGAAEAQVAAAVDSLKRMKNLADDDNQDATQNFAGSYTIQAKDGISLYSENGKGEARAITIASRGSGDNGNVTILGTNAVQMGATSGQPSSGCARVVLDRDKGVLIQNTKGDISVVQGRAMIDPTIKLAPRDITLYAGGKNLTSIKLNKRSIKLQVGQAAAIELSARGVKISGLQIGQKSLLKYMNDTIESQVKAVLSQKQASLDIQKS